MTTLISFYTDDWKYPVCAQKLGSNCIDIKLPSVIQELPSTGSYLKNTCMKPQFIFDKLKELQSPVLWVDVDGSIFKYPELLYGLGDEAVDFAGRRMPIERKRTWHVGTMWFNYTPKMMEFLKRWIENTGNLSDESALEYTWQEFGHKLRTFDLPQQYFYIERSGRPRPQDTVVMHRISDGPVKRAEMPLATHKRKRGEW